MQLILTPDYRIDTYKHTRLQYTYTHPHTPDYTEITYSHTPDYNKNSFTLIRLQNTKE